MKITLARYSPGGHSTLGGLYVDDVWQCFTLEDPVREEKVYGETAIPAGEYEITLRREGGFHGRYQARFPDIHTGMLWVRDVPNYKWILIHIGNTPAHTMGCILVGDGATQNVSQPGSVSASTAAYRRIYPPIAAALERGERVTIEVTDG